MAANVLAALHLLLNLKIKCSKYILMANSTTKAKSTSKGSNSAKLPVITSAPQRKLGFYKQFIVVSEDGKPMSYDGEQFCYCTNEDWEDPHWPVQLYSRSAAKKLIEKTVKYRQAQGFDVGRYKLVPVWAHWL